MEMTCDKCGIGSDMNYWKTLKINDSMFNADCPECKTTHACWQDRSGGIHISILEESS